MSATWNYKENFYFISQQIEWLILLVLEKFTKIWVRVYNCNIVNLDHLTPHQNSYGNIL